MFATRRRKPEQQKVNVQYQPKCTSKGKMMEEIQEINEQKLLQPQVKMNILKPKCGPQVSLNYHHLSPSLGGLNTKNHIFSVVTTGNQTDQNLFVVDTASILGGSQGILSLSAFRMTLYNLPQTQVTQLPEIFYLTCDQIGGMHDLNGNPTNIVASAVPQAVTSSIDTYGLSVFTVIFGMTSQNINWDIGSSNTLTFKLKVGKAKQDAVYPLATEIITELNVVKIMI